MIQPESLAGRAGELQQLAQILATTLAGHQQMVWLDGDAGFGKMQLAAELARRAERRGARVCEGICQQADQTVTYQPWRQILEGLLDLADDRFKSSSQDERLDRLMVRLETAIEAINPDWLIRLPLLGDLLGLPIPDNATTAAFEPQTRRDALFGLVEDLLLAWAQDQPLLLILKDTHWLDEVSAALLLWLSRAQVELPVLFIITHNPSLAGAEVEALRAELKRWPYVHFLRLNELTPLEIAKLASQRLASNVSPLALEIIQAQAAGNSLFATILVNYMRSSGRLQRQDDSSWALAREMTTTLKQTNHVTIDPAGQVRLVDKTPLARNGLGLPDSIQAIIRTRLDQLPELLRETLNIASVIGQHFEFDLLAESHPARLDQSLLREQLNRLVELDFLRRAAGTGHQSYLFNHSIYQEVTYATLTGEQQRGFHRAVGVALEKRRPEALERLAYHYSRSGVRNKMLTYLEQAAGEAERKYANETALIHYTEALALEERWSWRRSQAQTLHTLGRRAEEKASLQALGGNLETPTFQVGLLWGRYYEAIGDYPKAQATIELALADSRDKGDLTGEAQCLSHLGLIARRQGNYGQAKAWYKQALIRFQKKQNLSDRETRGLIQVLNGLGTVYRHQGEFDQARQFHEEALTLSRQNGNRSGQAQAYNDLGVTTFYQRRLTEALAFHQQALEIRRSVGDLAGEGSSSHNLAQLALHAGDYGQAQQHLSEALRILRRTGNRWDEINALNDLGILYQELGDWPKAETCLQQGLALAQEIGDQAGQAYILSNLGLVARDKGKLETAENLFTTGLILVRSQNDQYLISVFLNYLSLVSLELKQPEQAILQAKSSLALRQELKMRYATPDNLAVLAASCLALGNLTEAMAWVDQAEILLAECDGEGPEFPQQDYYLIYQVLSAAGQFKRAQRALEMAYQLVSMRADKIVDPYLRQSFLERVALNRAIVETYQTTVTTFAQN